MVLKLQYLRFDPLQLLERDLGEDMTRILKRQERGGYCLRTFTGDSVRTPYADSSCIASILVGIRAPYSLGYSIKRRLECFCSRLFLQLRRVN